MDIRDVMGGANTPYLKIVRPPPGGQLKLVLLSPRLASYWTHWGGDREELCLSDQGHPCTWCKHDAQRRFSVYAVAYAFPGPKLAIAHFPQSTFRYNPDLQAVAEDARGVCVTLKRGRGTTGPVFANVHPRRWDGQPLPEVGGMLQLSLWRLWRVPDHVGQPPTGEVPLPDEPDEPPGGSASNGQQANGHNGHNGHDGHNGHNGQQTRPEATNGQTEATLGDLVAGLIGRGLHRDRN